MIFTIFAEANLLLKKRGADGERKGLYHIPIIQDAVNLIWFRNKSDEGIRFPEFYRPVPDVGLALILTAVSTKFLSNIFNTNILHLLDCRLNVASMNGPLELAATSSSQPKNMNGCTTSIWPTWRNSRCTQKPKGFYQSF
jgi:hypothetical protein